MGPNRWYDLKYPNPIIYTEFGNVKVIKHYSFADLIGLSGVLRANNPRTFWIFNKKFNFVKYLLK